MARIRHYSIKITNQARVLRILRSKQELSMRQAGELCGKSAAYISHIENGRMGVPSGADLERLLQVYGETSVAEFERQAEVHRVRLDPRDEILELLDKTKPGEVQLLLKITRAMLA